MLNSGAGGLCAGSTDGSTAADTIAEVYTTEGNFLRQPNTSTYNAALTQNFAILCKAKSALGAGANVPAGTAFSVIKFSSGSGNGINEVALGTVLASNTARKRNWVDVTACRTAVTPVTVVGSTIGTVDFKVYVGCAVNTTGLRPKIGVSDVEPALLSSQNPLFPVAGGPTSANVAAVTPNQGAAVGFAPIVSRPLYIALQRAQGIAGGCALDGSAADQTEACMPTISTATLRAIFEARATSTNQLTNAAGAAIATLAGVTPPASTTLFICRREDSSGTQVSFQSFYLGQGCVKTPRTFVASNNGTSGEGWDTSTNQAVRVFGGNGASEVKKCMDARSAANNWAIGLMSTENTNGNGTDDWRYVKVDGFAPSLENTVLSRYTFFSENTFNVPNTNQTLNAAQADIYAALLGGVRTASNLANTNVAHPFGTGGLLAVPQTKGTAWRPGSPSVATTPVNSMTKAGSYGNIGDNCTPALAPGNNAAADGGALKWQVN
jgi:hypothetical protein